MLDALAQKQQGQVLNRAELIADEDGIDFWVRFRLEPEFLVVVIAALVHTGAVVLSIPGKKYGASAIDQLSRALLSDLTHFKHIERPKGLPLEPLKALFELLGVAKGKLIHEASRDQAVNEMQIKIATQVEKLVLAQAKLRQDFVFWGRSILSQQETSEWDAKLGGVKQFLESLRAFNTAGKLNNFPHDVATVEAQRPGLARIKDVAELADLVAELTPATAYLSIAEGVLPADHPWQTTVHEAKATLCKDLRLKQLQQLANVETMPAQQWH